MSGQVSPTREVLVGRDAALAQLESMLAMAPAVLVTGEAGVGKSHLAHCYADRLAARGKPVLRAAGLAALADRPLGALRPLLGPVQASSDDPAGWAADRLRDVAGCGILVVDDVDSLDQTSAVALHRLVAAPVRDAAPRVLSTLRAGGVVPDPVERLLTSGQAKQLWLPPLSEEHVVALASTLLSGPVEPRTAQQLAEHSAGNPLFVRELVHAGWDEGSWQHTAEGWMSRTPLHAARRLRPFIDFRIAGLEGAAWELAQTLALAGNLALDMVLELDLIDGVGPLERTGLARTTAHEVALTHPLFVEAIVSRTESAHRDRIVGHLLEASRDRNLPLGTALRITTLALERNHHIEADRVMLAAHMAMALHDLPLARALAEAAARPDGDPCAEVLAASAGAALGDPAATDDLMNLLCADDLEVREAATVAYARLRVGREQPAEILAMLPVGHTATSEAVRASGLMRSGKWRAATQAAEHALDLASETGEWLDAAWMGCVLHTWGSDVATGLRLAQTGLKHIEDGAVVPAQLPITMSQVATVAAALVGEPALARQVAEFTMPGAEDSAYFRGNRSVRLGTLALFRGSVENAERHLTAGIEDLSQHDPLDLRSWALSHLAQAFAVSGRGTAASEAAARASAALPPGQASTALVVAQGAAWAAAGLGDADRAAGLLASVAEQWVEANTAYCLVAIDVARCGDVDTAQRLLTRADSRNSSPILSAAVQVISAAASRDLEQVLDGAATLQRGGLQLWAADLLAVASARFSGEEADRLEQRAYLAGMGCRGARTPALSRLQVDLTPTQRRVVALAARGMSNRQIGECLEMSPRTAATHLHRAYQTLNVHDRRELAHSVGAPVLGTETGMDGS